MTALDYDEPQREFKGEHAKSGEARDALLSTQ